PPARRRASAAARRRTAAGARHPVAAPPAGGRARALPRPGLSRWRHRRAQSDRFLRPADSAPARPIFAGAPARRALPRGAWADPCGAGTSRDLPALVVERDRVAGDGLDLLRRGLGAQPERPALGTQEWPAEFEAQRDARRKLERRRLCEKLP